ncbi:TetR/AcrR family transcriptional regulator [Sanguibacter suaedae]|uniref:TetR/AcrR family transcriptional regulator n=1 Tax=Sanguibacter suaedae TaxID=2795737 RepID=A0A934IDA2_9MICO|nr:TetR/AcrR family transcriptional regulator [Sanguibacter suaedae]MBI9115716.1 TetR/AcrR family transcriptional regulator [Sanguibacter suaedae]
MSTRSVKHPDVRRTEILAAARELFADHGIARTSIADIAEHVGVTRGLVYHYHGDKEALVDAVLEAHIDEFVESVRAWDAQREVGEIDEAITSCVALFSRHLRGQGPAGQPCADLPLIEDAALYNRFLDRAVRALVDRLVITGLTGPGTAGGARIEHPPETLYVLVHGLVGLARSTPGLDRSTIATIVRRTLRTDTADRVALAC